MMRRILLISLVALLALGGALGATGQQEKKVLNFALSGNPDTLDPQKTAGTLTFQTLKSIYDTLVEPDMEGNIIPALAESWDISEDSLTWTFKLRRDVSFHNGDKLTSADVKATLERIMNKETTASPKASDFTAIKTVEAPDDYTVVLRLGAPAVPLLATLASGWAAILPKSLIDSGHDFASNPVGTGPFVFKEWVRDNKIVLEKNPSYWMKGLPKLDGVTFDIIPERAVQVQGLVAGQIDATEMVDVEDLPVLEASPNVKVEKMMTSLILVMGLNCSRPPLDDLRVRQAINMAIDKQKVLDLAYGGGMPIGTFMNYGNAFYKDFTGLCPYDPEKARSLLAQAGVGQDTVLEMFLPSNYPPHVKAGELYQQMLEQVGLNVKIQLIDWSTWLSDVYTAAKYDLTVIGHTGKLDPDGTLGSYGTEKRYVRWINPTAAGLIKTAAVTPNVAARKKLYDQALELMAREVPFVFLGTSYRRIGMLKNVKDFRMHPVLDTFDFRWTELE
jgi:peptide/nickel transport system substrate-binding protein